MIAARRRIWLAIALGRFGMPAAIGGLISVPGPAHAARAAAIVYPPVEPRALEFPRDFGAHPAYRIEWWYLTGRLYAAPGTAEQPLGVQLTFFRIRTGVDPDNPSNFAAKQLLLAHAAIADPQRGELLHGQRLARTGFGIATASTADTDVSVDRWRLARAARDGVYRGSADDGRFAIDLSATPTQPLLLQGERGYSRKDAGSADASPAASPAASYYYSEPQLELDVQLRLDGKTQRRLGRGWLDHEWSSALLPAHAAGWDWGGFNLDDGSTLTIFRVRAADSAARGFTYASIRAPGGAPRSFAPEEVALEPLQFWTSPRSGARYPVAQSLRVGARRFETRPLMPDQEFDAQGGSPAYWEGSSDLIENGRSIGTGYLELTGYAGPALGSA